MNVHSLVVWFTSSVWCVCVCVTVCECVWLGYLFVWLTWLTLLVSC